MAVSSAGEQVAVALGEHVAEVQARKDGRELVDALASNEPVAWLELDEGELTTLGPAHPLSHPDLAALAASIDGAWLDELGREWYRRKRQPVPEGQRYPQILDPQWRRGELLAWDYVFRAVRVDTYVVDDARFVAFDRHCVNPACPCGEVAVDFADERTRRALTMMVDAIGHAAPRLFGPPGQARSDDAALLERLWAAYVRRYPNYVARLAARGAALKAVSQDLRPAGETARATSKPGRNEACPCGSGKKYKRCCWLKSAAQVSE